MYFCKITWAETSFNDLCKEIIFIWGSLTSGLKILFVGKLGRMKWLSARPLKQGTTSHSPNRVKTRTSSRSSMCRKLKYPARPAVWSSLMKANFQTEQISRIKTFLNNSGTMIKNLKLSRLKLKKKNRFRYVRESLV